MEGIESIDMFREKVFRRGETVERALWTVESGKVVNGKDIDAERLGRLLDKLLLWSR